MYILTFKGKPQTIAAILRREKSDNGSDAREDALYICGPSIKSVREAFIYQVGFTWAEHVRDGYNIRPVNIAARYAKGVKVGRAA